MLIAQRCYSIYSLHVSALIVRYEIFCSQSSDRLPRNDVTCNRLNRINPTARPRRGNITLATNVATRLRARTICITIWSFNAASCPSLTALIVTTARSTRQTWDRMCVGYILVNGFTSSTCAWSRRVNRDEHFTGYTLLEVLLLRHRTKQLPEITENIDEMNGGFLSWYSFRFSMRVLYTLWIY